ncbi:hypothetical protein ACVB78_11830, partial [Priestia aryabhattai]
VQDFVFRGRPMSLLVAYAPEGSHLFRFARRSLRLALQLTAITYGKSTFTIIMKKSERVESSVKNLD